MAKKAHIIGASETTLSQNYTIVLRPSVRGWLDSLTIGDKVHFKLTADGEVVLVKGEEP